MRGVGGPRREHLRAPPGHGRPPAVPAAPAGERRAGLGARWPGDGGAGKGREGAEGANVDYALFGARGPGDLEPAFRAMAQARAEALLLYRGTMFTSPGRVADPSLRHRLPTMGSDEGFAKAGAS